MFPETVFVAVTLLLFGAAVGLDRRPTISYITQPEIVTDIGGKVKMECTVQVSLFREGGKYEYG